MGHSLYQYKKEGQAVKALVVVYNKPLSQSKTIHSLSGAHGIEVYIADNSTVDCGNREFASARGYHYFDMGGNAGLSRAYNRVISALEKDDGLICLFDDDTTIDKAYFDVLKKDASAYKHIDIFAPVVKDKKGILSPCIFNGIRGKRVKRLENIQRRGVSAINSGLAIRLRVFRNYRYDEGLFLDYVDHAFIRDVADNDGSKIHILNISLKQSFSGSESVSKEDILNRYRTFKKDLLYFCRKYGVSIVRCRLFLLARRVHIMIKVLYKTIRGKHD